MTKSGKIGSEITVRISLTFQDAPDVHTLLAATPVRDRGKLIRLALERYIVATNHPAGNVESQIEAVSLWLRNRVSTAPACLAAFAEAPQREINPLNSSRQGKLESDSPNHDSEHHRLERLNEQRVDRSAAASGDRISTSIRRWLAD
jgi:hypothetical protein